MKILIGKATTMTVNTLYLTLTVVWSILIFNIYARKCCDTDCSSKSIFRKTMCNIYDLIFIILIVTIFEGRTMTRFQEHFPGFITYKESEAVKVLSIENINGIDFWEAVVSH